MFLLKFFNKNARVTCVPAITNFSLRRLHTVQKTALVQFGAIQKNGAIWCV